MITDDTGTVDKGHWEINTALTVEQSSGSSLLGIPLLDLNFGTNRNTQVKLEIPWLSLQSDGIQTVSGLGNTNIGVRWRFRDEDDKHRIAVSTYPQIEFNTSAYSADRGLAGSGTEFLLPIQWQTAVGKWAIGGDFGWRFTQGPTEMIYGLIIGTELNPKVEVMGEIHGSGSAENLRDSEIVLNFGSRITLDSQTKLIFSAGRSIRDHANPGLIGYLGLQVNL